MKKLVCCAALLVCALSVVALSEAQEAPLGMPLSDQHKLLAKEAGVWDVQMKMWPMGPAGDVMEGKGVETNVLVCNGLWLRSEFRAEFVGVKFEGHGMIGYDPAKKKYSGTWVDNMNASLRTGMGNDNASGARVMWWDAVDPATGQTVKERHVMSHNADGSRTFDMFRMGPDGAEIRMMTMTMTKRASS